MVFDISKMMMILKSYLLLVPVLLQEGLKLDPCTDPGRSLVFDPCNDPWWSFNMWQPILTSNFYRHQTKLISHSYLHQPEFYFSLISAQDRFIPHSYLHLSVDSSFFFCTPARVIPQSYLCHPELISHSSTRSQSWFYTHFLPSQS